MKHVFFLFLTAFTLGSAIGQDGNEPNDDFVNATPLECGATAEAYIQVAGDQDWYEVVIQNSGTFSARLTSVPNSIQPSLEVYQSSGSALELLTDDGDNFTDGGQQVSATTYVEAGTYYILVEDQSDSDFDAENQYVLSLVCTSNPAEINQTVDLAFPISSDTCFTDNIWGENATFAAAGMNGDDRDWFIVEVDSSGSLKVELNAVPAGINPDLQIFQMVNGAPFSIADDNDSFTDGGQLVQAVAYVEPGTYYIRVQDQNNDATDERNYNMCVSLTANPAEINQTVESAFPISSDTCFTDNIWGENETFAGTGVNGDDRDWFVVEVDSSGSLKVELNAVPAGINPDLQIFQMVNGAPVSIADDNDSFTDGGQLVEAVAYVEPGTYYIRVQDQNNDARDERNYNMCVSLTANPAEINQTVELAFPISSDTCFTDNIWGENETFAGAGVNGDDRDWFIVEVDSSGSLKVELNAVPAGINPDLQIFQMVNGAPFSIADDNDSFTDGGQLVEAVAYVEPGTYYIRVQDQNNDSRDERDYNICVSLTANPAEVNQTVDFAFPISADTCLMDNIWGENETFSAAGQNGDDRDWFTFTIDEPGQFSALLRGVPAGINPNMVLYQYDEDESLEEVKTDGVSFSSGGQNLDIEIDTLDAGTYYLLIEDQSNDSRDEEMYSLCLIYGNTVSTVEISSLAISLFPNPTQNNITVTYGDQLADKPLTLRIFGADGRQLADYPRVESGRSLDLKGLPSGLLLFQFRVDGEMSTLRVVKEGQ